MKALVVGGGGREHAIAAGLSRDGTQIYSVMKNRNPGIARLAADVLYSAETDMENIVEFARKSGVDFTVVGPEDPLTKGIADALAKENIPCIGPKKDAAQLEGSKWFMRKLMREHDVPGGIEFRHLCNMKAATEFVHSPDNKDKQFAVKPVGLTGGKGVKIEGEHLKTKDDVLAYCREIIEGKIGGGDLLLEERLVGEEFTLMCFVDGKNVVPMPAVQDHKRAYEGDTGPNTGGMGSYSQQDHLLPFLTRKEYDQGVEIVKKTIEALNEEGMEYKGFLYGQFILTKTGLRVIEFNVRYGDPEAMNLIPLISSSFTDICDAICKGTLPQTKVEFYKKASVCKYVVPKGYGVKSEVGVPLDIDEEAIKNSGAILYYANVNENDGKIETLSSRTLAITGLGDTIEQAERIAQKGLGFVKGEYHSRPDIGTAASINRKIENMKRIRGA